MNLPLHPSNPQDPEAESPSDTRVQAQLQIRQLEAVVEPIIVALGYELVAVEWIGTARPRVLRLYVDGPGGITLDDCSRLSPMVSTALDAVDHHDDDGSVLRAMLEAPYSLEVSSPGLDRPLVKPAHFARATGSRAVVRTWAPIRPGSTQKNFQGRVVGFVPEGDDPRAGRVQLADLDDPETLHEIPLALIRRANLVYEGEI